VSDIQKLVKESVDEINQQNLEEVEREVKNLVKGIIQKQAKIKSLGEEIVADKDRLRKLQVPETVVLEL
jgi:hypothetical protein